MLTFHQDIIVRGGVPHQQVRQRLGVVLAEQGLHVHAERYRNVSHEVNEKDYSQKFVHLSEV